MNKKGYTLIEIIAVIVLVGSIGTFGAIGLAKIISNSKSQRYDDMIEDLKSAGNTYFTIYSEYQDYDYLKTDLYNNGRLVISINDLKSALLVDQNLKNPKTNEAVDGCVVITYSSGALNYEVYLYKLGSNSTSCNTN